MEVLIVLGVIGLLTKLIAKIVEEIKIERHDSVRFSSANFVESPPSDPKPVKKVWKHDLYESKEQLDIVAEKVINLEYRYQDLFNKISYLVDKNYLWNQTQIDSIFNNVTFWEDSSNCPLAFPLAGAGYIFSISILIQYGNPTTFAGWTVAHEMAKQGYIFSKEELELLGNPADVRGLTLSDIRDLNNHKFPESEEQKHETVINKFGFSSCASYDIHANYMHAPEPSKLCMHCGSKLDETEIKMSVAAQDIACQDYFPCHWFSFLYTCKNCQWWCVRENFWLGEFMQHYDVLLIGVINHDENPGQSNQKPWEKYLTMKSVYSHDLNMTYEIKKLFQ